MLLALLLTVAAPAAHADWDLGVRHALDDAVTVEALLSREDLGPADTSLVRLPSGDPDAKTTWARFDGISVFDRATRTRRSCNNIRAHDPVPGGRKLVTWRDPPGRTLDRTGAALVLATGAEGELAMAQLRPGERLQIVEVQDTRTGVRSELVELSSADGEISLLRDGRSLRLCGIAAP